MSKCVHPAAQPRLAPWRKGVTEAARVTGRSKAHISYVLRGMRKPGRELAKVLREMGFDVEVA